jgi:hypothetical protein
MREAEATLLPLTLGAFGKNEKHAVLVEVMLFFGGGFKIKMATVRKSFGLWFHDDN